MGRKAPPPGCCNSCWVIMDTQQAMCDGGRRGELLGDRASGSSGCQQPHVTVCWLHVHSWRGSWASHAQRMAHCGAKQPKQ